MVFNSLAVQKQVVDQMCPAGQSLVTLVLKTKQNYEYQRQSFIGEKEHFCFICLKASLDS